MNFEEKLIRYMASKMLQRKYLAAKRKLPSEKQLAFYLNQAVDEIKNRYKQFSLVRRHADDGLLTPLIREIVDQIHIH